MEGQTGSLIWHVLSHTKNFVDSHLESNKIKKERKSKIFRFEVVAGLHKACESSLSFRVKGNPENVYLRHSKHILKTASYSGNEELKLEKDASFLKLSSLSGGDVWFTNSRIVISCILISKAEFVRPINYLFRKFK